jgi:hypothetical protein
MMINCQGKYQKNHTKTLPGTKSSSEIQLHDITSANNIKANNYVKLIHNAILTHTVKSAHGVNSTSRGMLITIAPILAMTRIQSKKYDKSKTIIKFIFMAAAYSKESTNS